MGATATTKTKSPSGAKSLRPRYQRAAAPPPLQLQPRDGGILRFIHECDGVVSKRQLQERFWPGATQRAMERRLSRLYHNGYLDWPTLAQWRACPVPEPLCWLGWRGALHLAAADGLIVRSPARETASSMARLKRDLRRVGFRWVREPRWMSLVHDLAVVDLRLRLEAALAKQPHLHLETWLAEGVFRARPDSILCGGKKKHVLPDAVFSLWDVKRESQGQPARARFLVELDNATHDAPSFGREKVRPGLAYLQSEVYRQRFGDRAGRWLVVTRGGERRLAHLMAQTSRLAGSDAHLFLFTTWEALCEAGLLADPLWRLPGGKGPQPLFPR